MKTLQLIIKREYLSRVRNRSFVIMTLLSPVIMVVFVVLIAYLSQLNSKQKTLVVLDKSGIFEGQFKSTPKLTFNFLEDTSLTEAKEQVANSNDAGLLYIPQHAKLAKLENNIKFFSKEAASISLIASLEDKLNSRLTTLKLEQNGVSRASIAASNTSVTIAQETFLGKKSTKEDSIVKLIFGGAAGYLLFMFIIIYGNMIMRSVIEEKTSRIIELIISSVKPRQLLLGKIMGTSLAGITQFTIWVVLWWVLIALLGGLLPEQLPSSTVAAQGSELGAVFQKGLVAFNNLPLANLIFAFFAFFIFGYLLYSSLYAAVGAAVDSETDSQQFMLPILVPLILAVYVGIFTVIEDPHGTVSTVFSHIPLTSPVVMLMRIPFGVPWWEQLISVGILILTFFGVIWMASKIYRTGILMYGKKASYRDLIDWIKY